MADVADNLIPDRDASFEGEAHANALPRFVWWNFWTIALDAAFWFAGMACMDQSAVLPVFLNTLTDSKLLIGFLIALPGFGWTLPQLIGCAGVMHQPRKKRYLLLVCGLGRIPMLLIPALLLFFPLQSKTLMLGILVVCYSILFVTDGLIAAAWFDIIGKAIPARMRGRFFAAMSLLSGIGGVASGWIVKRILSIPLLPYPHQYGVLFTCLCAGLVLSFIMLMLIREPKGPVASEQAQSFFRILSRIPSVWQNSPALRKLIIVSWLNSFSGLAWPFYALYGMKALHLPAESGAVFIWAGTIGGILTNLIWGWVNDRKGPRLVVIGYSTLKITAPALALGVPLIINSYHILTTPQAAQYLFALVFFSGGVIGTMMGFTNYILELAPAEERPLFITLGNTLTAPGLLAPLIGGWLVSLWSYQAVFILAAILGVITVIISLSLPEPKVHDHLAPYLPPESDHRMG